MSQGQILTRETVANIIQIAQEISESDVNGKNLNWHKENIPKYAPFKEKIRFFAEKFGNTPNVILKEYLDEYLISKHLADFFKSEGKHFYSDKVNSFTWACITPKVKKSELKHEQFSVSSQCPQLYILIDAFGIEFGFDYGFHVANDDLRVQSIKSQNKFLSNLFDLVRNMRGLEIYENVNKDSRYNQIEYNSQSDLKEQWSKDIMILNIIPTSNIPLDLDEQIRDSFDKLLNIFVFSSLISEWSPVKITEYLDSKREDTYTSVSMVTGEKKKVISYKKFEEDQEIKDEEARNRSNQELYEKAKLANPTPLIKTIIHQLRQRDSNVAEYAKRRAGGVCQLCKLPAPFTNRFGSPYLETHHIDWLSKNGQDSIENTVALCPNCHKKMHILDHPHDREGLKAISRANIITET